MRASYNSTHPQDCHSVTYEDIIKYNSSIIKRVTESCIPFTHKILGSITAKSSTTTQCNTRQFNGLQ